MDLALFLTALMFSPILIGGIFNLSPSLIRWYLSWMAMFQGQKKHITQETIKNRQIFGVMLIIFYIIFVWFLAGQVRKDSDQTGENKWTKPPAELIEPEPLNWNK